MIIGVLLVPLVVFIPIDQEKYWLALIFAVLFLALSDPCAYAIRLRGNGTRIQPRRGSLGVLVLTAFVVTLLRGLSARVGR